MSLKSVASLNCYTERRCALCRYTDYRKFHYYAERHYAECRYAEHRGTQNI